MVKVIYATLFIIKKEKTKEKKKTSVNLKGNSDRIPCSDSGKLQFLMIQKELQDTFLYKKKSTQGVKE